MVFLSQKVDRNMIFTDYWKDLVLIFSEIGNTVFSWAIKLMEKWLYWLLKRYFFELFVDGKYGLFLSQEVHGKMIFNSYWEVLVLNFSVMGNMVIFSAKMLIERCYLRGLFELFMIFQDLGNMVFHAVIYIYIYIYIEYVRTVSHRKLYMKNWYTSKVFGNFFNYYCLTFWVQTLLKLPLPKRDDTSKPKRFDTSKPKWLNSFCK